MKIRIDGAAVEPIAADILEVEPGVYSVLSGPNSWEARITGNEITIDGHRFHFEIDDPRQWKRAAQTTDGHGHASIRAAMPGKVVRILVSVGDVVEAGQGIVVVEAMKMQNELKAPLGGRITAIKLKENDTVTAGALLATIGPVGHTVPGGPNSREARIAGNKITTDSHRLHSEIDPRQWKRAAHIADGPGHASIRVAMPGKVVGILVSVGDVVKAGQAIVVVEAMKMQNKLKAPLDGRITAIKVKENDTVTAGALLATIGPVGHN